MIYNESTKSFIKLETALKELGFDQQTIDLALILFSVQWQRVHISDI